MRCFLSIHIIKVKKTEVICMKIILLPVNVLTVIVDVVIVNTGNSYGYQTSLFDIWINILVYDLSEILLTGCIMLFIYERTEIPYLSG